MYNWVLNTILQNKLKEDSVLWKNQTLKKHNFFSRLSVIFKFLANTIYYKFFWWLHFGRCDLILGVHGIEKKKKKIWKLTLLRPGIKSKFSVFISYLLLRMTYKNEALCQFLFLLDDPNAKKLSLLFSRPRLHQ